MNAFDPVERLEVLTAMRSELLRRCQAVALPEEMSAYADSIEAQGRELIAKAESMRQRWKADCEGLEGLVDQIREIELEVMAIGVCRNQKIACTKSRVRAMVDRAKRIETKGD